MPEVGARASAFFAGPLRIRCARSTGSPRLLAGGPGVDRCTRRDSRESVPGILAESGSSAVRAGPAARGLFRCGPRRARIRVRRPLGVSRFSPHWAVDPVPPRPRALSRRRAFELAGLDIQPADIQLPDVGMSRSTRRYRSSLRASNRSLSVCSVAWAEESSETRGCAEGRPGVPLHSFELRWALTRAVVIAAIAPLPGR